MNDLLLLGVDLIPATVGECAVGGSDLLLRRSMHRIGPFWTVGIHKVSAHVTVALVHEEALTVGSIGGIWPSGPVFHGVFSGNHLPRAHDSIANFRFGLSECRGGAKQKSEQKQCGGFHVGYFSGSTKFQLRGTAAYHVSERRLCPSELADTKVGVLPNRT